MKRCFKCSELKSLDEFYAHPAMGDGYLNKCKDCAKRDVRSHRLANADKIREYDRSRSQRPERIAGRIAEYERERREHPDRVKARNTLSTAVRDGKVQKAPCAFCGEGENLEAHHHDYNKPLDVTWLCRPCHRRFHALERMATYDRAAA